MGLVPHNPIVLGSLFHPLLCLLCKLDPSLQQLFPLAVDLTVHNHISCCSVVPPDPVSILLVDHVLTSCYGTAFCHMPFLMTIVILYGFQ